MKIIDCFPYFKERELLELRVRMLEDKVDLFVICEGNYTQSGIKKDYTCRETIKQLGLPEHKIKVIEVNLPSFLEEPDCWVRERQQRDAAAEYIDGNTIAYVGDCDEIINPRHLDYYVWMAQRYPQNILRVPLVYLNCRADLRVHSPEGPAKPWNSSFMCMRNHIETCTLSEIRESHAMRKQNVPFSDIFITENGVIHEAGWHFSWMGNSEQLKEKCLSSMHVHDIVLYAVAPMGSPAMLKFIENYKPIEGATDPMGRPNHILKNYPITELPEKLFELPHVRDFLLPL